MGHAFYRHAGDGPLHEHELQRRPDGVIHDYRRGFVAFCAMARELRAITLAPTVARRAGDGKRYCCHALHRHGGAGSDARDYLGQGLGGHFGRDCACRFTRGIMADLPPASRSRAGRADAHGGRHHDGNCDCRDALCRHESGAVSDVHNGSP